jgi:hypothetical protein
MKNLFQEISIQVFKELHLSTLLWVNDDMIATDLDPKNDVILILKFPTLETIETFGTNLG